jgi:hypothetical protein
VRHYAAALDPSVTVMRNFYHAGTNAGTLATMMLSKIKATAPHLAGCG